MPWSEIAVEIAVGLLAIVIWQARHKTAHQLILLAQAITSFAERVEPFAVPDNDNRPRIDAIRRN
jgi:hypothetical protein